MAQSASAIAKKKPGLSRNAQQKPAILRTPSLVFLKNYLNTASPVGFETKGQKLWLEYLKPFVDNVDTTTRPRLPVAPVTNTVFMLLPFFVLSFVL